MADVKISELSNATTLTDDDILAGVNNGTTRKFTLRRIRDFLKTAYDIAYAAKEHTHSGLFNGTYTAGLPTLTRNTSLAIADDLTGAKISYDNDTSGMQAENVQAAIDELHTAEGTLAETVAGFSDAISANTQHRQNTNNPHNTTAAQVGAIPASEKGAANGVPGLNASKIVPDTQLPVYVKGVTFSIEGTTLVLRATVSR